MEETKKAIVRETINYDVENMIVTRWGAKWAYWRYDVTGVANEVKLYCLKGFIDDLNDCTTIIKKADFTRAGKFDEAAWKDACMEKRKELLAHINAGTRPRSDGNSKAKELARLTADITEATARLTAYADILPTLKGTAKAGIGALFAKDWDNLAALQTALSKLKA